MEQTTKKTDTQKYMTVTRVTVNMGDSELDTGYWASPDGKIFKETKLPKNLLGIVKNALNKRKEWDEMVASRCKPVQKIRNGIIEDEYASLTEAAKAEGMTKGLMSRACNGGRKAVNGVEYRFA